MTMQKIQVNDVFRCSWGYDQTNVDFYQVIRVISEKTIEVRPIASKSFSESKVIPVLNHFTGDKFRRHPRKSYDDTVYINGESSFMSASLWDGNPCYETPANCGH